MAGWHGVLKEHERAELIRSSCVSSIPLLGPASQFLLTLDAMFDPELAILLLDLDESVHCWLRAEGVEHCCDIHFGWSSEDDLSGSFQRFVADRQLDFDISQLDRLWRAAGRSARTEAASTASAVSAARLSVHLPVTAKGNAASSEVQPKRRKVMVPWRSVPTAVAPAVSLSSSALGPARLDEKAQKVVALFQICASLFLDLQEVGFASLQWEDSAAVEAARVVMKAAFRLSVQRLGMLASTMRRWMRWACEHSAPAGCPAAADLAAFLQHVSLGGPTAASSVFQVCGRTRISGPVATAAFYGTAFPVPCPGACYSEGGGAAALGICESYSAGGFIDGYTPTAAVLHHSIGLLVHSFCTFSAVPLGGGP